MVSQPMSRIQRPLSFHKSHIGASTVVVHMVSQPTRIRRPLSFNKSHICASTIVVHMVSLHDHHVILFLGVNQSSFETSSTINHLFYKPLGQPHGPWCKQPLSIHAQLFEHPIVILREPTRRVPHVS